METEAVAGTRDLAVRALRVLGGADRVLEPQSPASCHSWYLIPCSGCEKSRVPTFPTAISVSSLDCDAPFLDTVYLPKEKAGREGLGSLVLWVVCAQVLMRG